MKLTDLGIDGFGVWTQLEVRDFSPTLNVFYGPNEAGKTTLLEFIRAVLYGFTPERRRRYLPPARGGEPGGWLALFAGGKSFDIARSDRANSLLGETVVSAAEGTLHGDDRLRELLSDVDEAIFQNVFAIGLEELQHLGTLDGTAAAQLLYGISAGLDRVSLAEVMRELDASRRRLLSDEAKSQIGELLAEREKICAEIDELAESTRCYWRLAAEREELCGQIAEAEAEVARLDRHARLLQLARDLARQWDERAALDQQLASLGPQTSVPPNALERMQRVRSRVRHHRRQLVQIKARRQQLKTAAAEIPIRDQLLQLGPRIEALAENQAWIASVEAELLDANRTVVQLASRLSAGLARLGIVATPGPAGGDPAGDTDLSPRRLSRLRAPATEMRRALRAARDAKALVSQGEKEAETQRQSLAAALAARGLDAIGPALEQAGQAVAQWRRRVQLDDRLERMTRHRVDLEEENHASLDQQIMPGWMLASLGGVFVTGVLLIFAGWLLPSSFTGAFGWLLSILGVAALAAAAGTKWMLERSAARRLESCQKQLAMLDSQASQIADERASLDKQLPSGGTPSARLQAAEAELAALEELLPLETKRQSAEQQLPLVEREAAQAREKLRAAHQQWQSALASTQLPRSLTPKKLRQWNHRRAGAADVRKQFLSARAQRDRIERELAALASRIQPILAASGLALQSDSPAEQLRQLSRELADETTRAARRQAILAELKSLDNVRSRRRTAVVRWRRRGKSLLKQAGAANLAELASAAALQATANDLAQRRERIDRELAVACVGVGDSAELAALLDSPNRAERLHMPGPEHVDSSQAARAALHALLEERGRLAQEMESLAGDRRLGVKQLELGTVEQRLAEAIERWQVLSLTLRILQQIKEDYEQKGQPETLQRASEYLARLTDGRYCRVWTPLGENTLLVDDAGGGSLAVELLSRGAREQLFLALRLALVDYYSRRGVEMPLVLDDVLVNFDDGRSTQAAELLRDFAAAGHQLLVFTCHERLAGVFESLGAAVRRLPRNTDPGQIVAAPDRPTRIEAPAASVPEIPAEPSAQPPVELLVEPPTEPQPGNGEEPPRQPARRRRAKAAKTETERDVEPLNAPPPEASNGHSSLAETAEEPAAESIASAGDAPADMPPPSPPRQRRSDPPHRLVRSAERRRWSAEEFDGELEDRVRPPEAEERGSGRDDSVRDSADR